MTHPGSHLQPQLPVVPVGCPRFLQSMPTACSGVKVRRGIRHTVTQGRPVAWWPRPSPHLASPLPIQCHDARAPSPWLRAKHNPRLTFAVNALRFLSVLGVLAGVECSAATVAEPRKMRASGLLGAFPCPGYKNLKLWVCVGNGISFTNNVSGGWLHCFGKGAQCTVV